MNTSSFLEKTITVWFIFNSYVVITSYIYLTNKEYTLEKNHLHAQRSSYAWGARWLCCPPAPVRCWWFKPWALVSCACLVETYNSGYQPCLGKEPTRAFSLSSHARTFWSLGLFVRVGVSSQLATDPWVPFVPICTDGAKPTIIRTAQNVREKSKEQNAM